MTAEVGIYNTPLITDTNNAYPIGKDVLDDGTSLLTSNLTIRAAELFLTEKNRLESFKNWPNKRIEPKKLAAAGFYYSGKADIVECYVCGIKGHNWLENDKPMEDHMRWNRNCPFVRQNSVTEHDRASSDATNTTSTSPTTTTTTPGRDICGNLGVEIFPNSEPEDSVRHDESNLERLGIQKAKGPSHPDQIIYETRLASFENWPKSLKQKPAELASAGFYYLGVGDQTLCFYCGGGLKDWVEEDDPWEQHALWFPKCNYLLLKKSPSFVETVQKRHKSLCCEKNEVETAAATAVATSSGGSCNNINAKETKRNDIVVVVENSQGVVENCNSKGKDLESTTLCKICFKNELGVVFLPCGHMVACIDCASALKECAVCRKNIQATVRAFLS